MLDAADAEAAAAPAITPSLSAPQLRGPALAHVQQPPASAVVSPLPSSMPSAGEDHPPATPPPAPRSSTDSPPVLGDAPSVASDTPLQSTAAPSTVMCVPTACCWHHARLYCNLVLVMCRPVEVPPHPRRPRTSGSDRAVPLRGAGAVSAAVLDGVKAQDPFERTGIPRPGSSKQRGALSGRSRPPSTRRSPMKAMRYVHRRAGATPTSAGCVTPYALAVLPKQPRYPGCCQLRRSCSVPRLVRHGPPSTHVSSTANVAAAAV